jgi:hypothetical protein
VALPGFDVQVVKATYNLADLELVAVLPPACQAEVNCTWVEKELDEDLHAGNYFPHIPSSRVRQEMLELNILLWDDEAREILAETLGVTSFLVPVITVAGQGNSGGSVGFYSGGVGFSGFGSSSTGGAELVFIRAGDGKEIIHGEGFGKSGFRSQKSVVRKVFRRILQEAFPASEDPSASQRP